jgi:Uncharacterized conserved protein
MKINPRCTYCLLSRIHYQCRLSTDDIFLINKVMKSCIETLGKEYDPEKTSTHIGTAVHRKCFEVLNDSDPYKYVKEGNNKTALEVLPDVRKLIYGEDEKGEAYSFESSPKSNGDIFKNAVLAAVIGNYFDFGVMGQDASDAGFKQKFISYFNDGLKINDTTEMMKLLSDVVYITDNCGEIVFDREVLEIIQKIQQKLFKPEIGKEKSIRPKLTLVVRGAPILTDATMKDADELKMEDVTDEILTTGSNAIGVFMKELPAETLTAMKNATLIISKGMANYESLSDEKLGPIAFLLRTKCEAVADSLGIETGQSVAKLVTNN